MKDSISKDDREMLRSILNKDNNRIREEMRGAKKEVVFRLGWEGGGLEVTRYKCSSGKTYFVTSGTNMTFDENDDDYWVPWEDAPTASFEGSLAELGMGVSLLCLRPSRVHRDYRSIVLEHADRLLGQVTKDDRQQLGDLLPSSANEWLSRLR